MTSSTATTNLPSLYPRPGESVLLLIGHVLEGLWLLAAFLVPLMFLDSDYAISEAKISYVEVPKVALLRTLGGLIAILWALEWAIKSNALQGSLSSISLTHILEILNPCNALSSLKSWLNVHPTRWFSLAAGLFFGSTFLSTVLSGSFNTSIWGEIQGQDGYSAYTIFSYAMLFGVIATHLKDSRQLTRLLSVLVLMGFLVGLYSSLQHFGNDFLGLTEETGGGTTRVTAFMGNAIFAGALLSMTVPLTLFAATVFSQNESLVNCRLFSILGQFVRESISTTLWASLLSVQLLGLMFTFSRGPWVGAVLALGALLVLIGPILGWRTLVRTGLVLGLAGIFSVSFLHLQGNVSIVNVGPWLGFVLPMLGLAGIVAVLYTSERFGKAVLFILVGGVTVSIIGMSIVLPSALSDSGSSELAGSRAGGSSTSSQVSERIVSIKSGVLGGFAGGRTTHWKVSWELIKNRPWFEFDDLSLSWLRPVIGYGPDLFRYTYLLESPPDDYNSLPLEPDHAHNFFIHQTVEQGILGGLASIALFASVAFIAGHNLIRRLRTANPMYQLLLIGLAAILFGRFWEMMVGVARISDFTVLWVIFGLFVASVGFDNKTGDVSEPVATVATVQSAQPLNRRNRRRTADNSPVRTFGSGLIFRLAMVAWLIGVIGVVTWQKSINSVRASVAESQALRHFKAGELEDTLVNLDRAINLAPGVPSYYNNRAQVFLAYLIRPEEIPEPGCQLSELDYSVCLAIKSFESNLESINQQPFNYRSRMASGNSAFNLNLLGRATAFYQDASGMVPNSWNIRNELGESLMNLGLFKEAIIELDRSLGITGNTSQSTHALFLKSKALSELGRGDEALPILRQGIAFSYITGNNLVNDSARSQASLDLMQEIFVNQGVSLDIEYLNALVDNHPEDASAYYNRGLAHLRLGDFTEANLDMEQVYSLGLRLSETIALKGYSKLKYGNIAGSYDDLTRASILSPHNPLINSYLGEVQLIQRNHGHSLNLLDQANLVDPELGLAYLIRSNVYLSLGFNELALESLNTPVVLDLPTAPDYVNRGEIQAFFGNYELAFSDLDEALRINPDQAHYYNARGMAYALSGNLQSALADFDIAIEKDSTVASFLINRAIVYAILGQPEHSSADVKVAQSLGDVSFPKLDDRNLSFFAAYTEQENTESLEIIRLKLKEDKQALLDIDYHSAIAPGNVNYLTSLQFLGQAKLELENWLGAIKDLSKLIELAPDVPETYKTRGDAYLALKRYGEAIADYDRAILLDPSNGDYFVARGNGFAESGSYETALTDFEEAVRLNPGSSNSYASRGYLSVQTGNPSAAFVDIDRAIEIDPSNHDAFAKRAEANAELGNTQRAIRDIGEAINLDPTNLDYFVSRGFWHSESQDYESGIDDFNLAIDWVKNLIPDTVESFSVTISSSSNANWRLNVDPKNARPYIGRAKAFLELDNSPQALNDSSTAIVILLNLRANRYWEPMRESIDLLLEEARNVHRQSTVR